MTHEDCGTYRGYHTHRRASEPPCQDCRKAKADYERAKRAERLAAGAVKHGGHSGWDAGCRCDECTSWHRAKGRAYYWERVKVS